MDSSLSAIKDQIEKERATLRAKANKLEGELAEIETQLDKLTNAINALNGKEEAVAARKPQSRKKNEKPAAGKEEVLKRLCEVLASEGVLDETELRGRVESRLTAAGFSRMGFALRFKEALRDPRLVDSPGGVRLKEDAEAALVP